MDKKWKVIALWVLPITIVILITWQILGSSTNTQVNQANTSNPSRNAPVAKISYGRFLDYVKAGRVTSVDIYDCLLYTSPSPRDRQKSRMPSSA